MTAAWCREGLRGQASRMRRRSATGRKSRRSDQVQRTTARFSSRRRSSRSFSANTASPGSSPGRSNRPYLMRPSNSPTVCLFGPTEVDVADQTPVPAGHLPLQQRGRQPRPEQGHPAPGLPDAVAAAVGESDRPTGRRCPGPAADPAQRGRELRRIQRIPPRRPRSGRRAAPRPQRRPRARTPSSGPDRPRSGPGRSPADRPRRRSRRGAARPSAAVPRGCGARRSDGSGWRAGAPARCPTPGARAAPPP